SPMTIAPPCADGVNAAQEPSPIKGGMDQPSTWTFTSLRALPTLKTFSSAIMVPFTPMICSIFAVSSADCAGEGFTRNDIATHRVSILTSILFLPCWTGFTFAHFRATFVCHVVQTGLARHKLTARQSSLRFRTAFDKQSCSPPVEFRTGRVT